MKTVLMFSGMGSQYFQMGRGLYLKHPFFRARVDDLAEIGEHICGENLLDRIYAPERKAPDHFEGGAAAGMSIVMIERALADTLAHEGIEPDLLLGSSLGLFAAASVAGCMSAQESLQSVFDLAHVVERYGEDGAMIAILAPIANWHDDARFSTLAEIAAINFDDSFVVALPTGNLPALEALLRHKGIMFHRLPIGRPFHSRWIDGAQDAVYRSLGSLGVRSALVPMSCCSKPGVMVNLTVDDLWSAVRQPILLQDAIVRLEATGPMHYIDAGPSGTLATSLKYILPANTPSRCTQTLTPFDQDARGFYKLIDSMHTMARSA